MKVVCHTDLALVSEVWPDELPAIPAVGDEIESATLHNPRGFRLTLKVVSVRWCYGVVSKNWYPHIELRMTDLQRELPCSKGESTTGSITAFYEWYAPLVGFPVGLFI